MDLLLANAERILEAAEASARASRAPGEWTVLVGRGGEIEMVADSDWSLEALRSERGAAMAFRVGEARGRVTVDGRMAGRACRLEAETPAALARHLLGQITPAWSIPLPALPPSSAH